MSNENKQNVNKQNVNEEFDFNFKNEFEDEINNNNTQIINNNSKSQNKKYELTELSKEQQKIPQELLLAVANEIKPGNSDSVINFGNEAQSELSRFSKEILNQVQDDTKIVKVKKDLDGLMRTLDSTHPDKILYKGNMITRLFKNPMNVVQEQFDKLQTTSGRIENVSLELSKQKYGLENDNHLLDDLFNKSYEYYQSLEVLIGAAKTKKNNFLQYEMEEIEKAANEDPNNMQAQQDLMNATEFIRQIDKKIYDLQLSRQITHQSAQQIRMIQNVNSALSQKVQSTLVTAIPMWNQQFSIAMALKKQALTTGIVKDVSDMTGKLAVENSKMLKQNAINVATEAEKPFIEIEKLVEANENIKTAIKEVIDIQRKGEEKRRMSIKELEQVEQNFGQLDDNNEGLNRLTNNTASTLKSNNFISNQNTNEAIANYVKSNKK